MYLLVTRYNGHIARYAVAEQRRFTPNGTLLVKVFAKKVVLTNAL